MSTPASIAINAFHEHPVSFADAMSRGVWRAQVIGIRDGDTIVVCIDRGFNDTSNRPIRVAGINTPELVGGTAETRAGAVAAKARTTALCLGQWALLRTYALPSGELRTTFDRWVADVLVIAADGTATDLGAALLAEGLADRMDRPL